MTPMSRRDFVKAGALGAAAAGAPAPGGAQAPAVLAPRAVAPVVVASANGHEFRNGGPRASRFDWRRVRLNREWRTVAALPLVTLLLYLRGH